MKCGWKIIEKSLDYKGDKYLEYACNLGAPEFQQSLTLLLNIDGILRSLCDWEVCQHVPSLVTVKPICIPHNISVNAYHDIVFYALSKKALNRILSVFTGHMNCIGKKSKLNAPRKRCMKIYILSDAIHMAREQRLNAIQSLYLHLFTTKFVAVLLTLTQKCHISKISNVQKSKTLRTASTGRMTNWTKPPCDPVQIIRTKDWCFLKFDYRKYSNILLLYKSTCHLLLKWT